MSTIRIDQIDIRDFRGFPRELVPAIKLDGKNLLIYGENGSGKSTCLLYTSPSPRDA